VRREAEFYQIQVPQVVYAMQKTVAGCSWVQVPVIDVLGQPFCRRFTYYPPELKGELEQLFGDSIYIGRGPLFPSSVALKSVPFFEVLSKLTSAGFHIEVSLGQIKSRDLEDCTTLLLKRDPVY